MNIEIKIEELAFAIGMAAVGIIITCFVWLLIVSKPINSAECEKCHGKGYVQVHMVPEVNAK